MPDSMSLKYSLLALLRDDPEVQCAVRQIAAAEEMLAPVTEQEAALVERVLPQEAASADALRDALDTIERQNHQIESLRQQQMKMQDVMAGYARLERVYGDYLELRPALREHIGSLLNDSSPLSFAVTGASLEALCDLHSFVVRSHPMLTTQELWTVNACFDLLFDLFLLGTSAYRRIVTHEGERFDPKLHCLTEDSIPDKRIVQVILPGFEGPEFRVRSCVRTGERDFGGETI